MDRSSRQAPATAIFFLCALALVFGAFSVGRKVNVDENVFAALVVAPIFARMSSTDTSHVEPESSSRLIADLLFEGAAPK